MRLIDTNRPDCEEELFSFGETYGVTGRSVLLFVLEAEAN